MLSNASSITKVWITYAPITSLSTSTRQLLWGGSTTYQPTFSRAYGPTNLPTYQPTSFSGPWVNQPTNLPTYQPTNLPTYQPTNLPFLPGIFFNIQCWVGSKIQDPRCPRENFRSNLGSRARVGSKIASEFLPWASWILDLGFCLILNIELSVSIFNMGSVYGYNYGLGFDLYTLMYTHKNMGNSIAPQ